MSLPKTCRALVCSEIGEPLKLETIDTPSPARGSAIVKIEAALCEPNFPDFLAGKMPWSSYPTPFTPGSRAIGRVAGIGPDSVALKVGQLVLIEPQLHARDDDTCEIMFGVFDGGSPQSNKLASNWRLGAWSEYIDVPLENCHALEEHLLEKYSAAELLAITMQLVGYGGLRSINVRPGDTVIVAPATGLTSAAAVEVASAMGARVIAASRNLELLEKVAAKNPRVYPYQIKGNVEEDLKGLQQFGKIDAYLEISPSKASHIQSCIMALRRGGRAALMGGSPENLDIPNATIMFNNLTLQGRWMYSSRDVKDMIKMVDIGLLKVGKEMGYEIVGEYGLEEWEHAFAATSKRAAGQTVVIVPSKGAAGGS